MLKKIIKKFISPLRRAQISRVLYKIQSGRKKENYTGQYRIVKNRKMDQFFGYYDISPFQNDQLIFLGVDSKMQGMIYWKNGEEIPKKVGETEAWCWQQGSRLRWTPGKENTIQWNDFKEGRYVTRVLNLHTHQETELPYPLYDVDAGGNYGITLDFNRLGYYRPGYGYTRLPLAEVVVSEGIDLIDLRNNSRRCVVSYQDVWNILGKTYDVNECYFNHLSFCPNGSAFLFFFLTKGLRHQARLFVYDIATEKTILLEDQLSVSHYCWIDDTTILVTAYDEKRACRYYRYHLNGDKEPFLHDLLVQDGHPTWINEECMITDTYPDDCGFQRVLSVNPKSKTAKTLAEVYSTAKYMGERRTDLHPRVDCERGRVCFDSNITGKRHLCILEGVVQDDGKDGSTGNGL